jgi:tetratricopeptide (TPR) repeat protein
MKLKDQPLALSMDTFPTIAASDRTLHVGLVPVLLDAALQAQRQGSLEELVRKNPLAARWMMRKHLRVLRGTAGDVLPRDALPQASSVLLSWLVTQLRPDGQTSFEDISEEAWLNLPGWRPALALASHLGLVDVPDFPRHHRRSNNEGALDNLCGLWNLDASTLYRILEKARHNIGQLLMHTSPNDALRTSLREWTVKLLYEQTGSDDRAKAHVEREHWHSRQARRELNLGDPVSALWHLTRANDPIAFIRLLSKVAPVVAHDVETDTLVDCVGALALAPTDLVHLSLARAALARTRNQPERELRAYEEARQVAQDTADLLLLGVVYSAMGKFYEPRDADRAFACYQDSAEFLRDLGPEQDDVQAIEHFVTTFARLAWLYLLRNDVRSKAVLDHAESLRNQFRVPDHVLGMLEQVWGQYWRRAGNSARSLEHRFRALNVFERLGDQRSVIAAYVNIGFDLAALGDHERAIEYSNRILAAARLGTVDAEFLVDAHINLGATHYWRGDPSAAISEYLAALDKSEIAGLGLHSFRTRYNLAEVHYSRFRDHGEEPDEVLGDAYISQAIAKAGAEVAQSAIKSAMQLKSELLKEKTPDPNRFIPHEDAVHFDELSEIHSQRDILAVPADPESHAQAHLVIARAYATIAAKEREAALVLVQRAGLQDRFSSDFTELQQTFERGLTREQQLANVWKQQASDLLDDTRRASLIAHVQRDGAINKSRYAELGAVSPATASKHLAMLTERGLLVQHGKGPSTRYQLPE